MAFPSNCFCLLRVCRVFVASPSLLRLELAQGSIFQLLVSIHCIKLANFISLTHTHSLSHTHSLTLISVPFLDRRRLPRVSLSNLVDARGAETRTLASSTLQPPSSLNRFYSISSPPFQHLSSAARNLWPVAVWFHLSTAF